MGSGRCFKGLWRLRCPSHCNGEGLAQMTQAANDVGRSREIAQIVESTDRVLGKHAQDMDQEARDIAHAAAAKIESHEELCTERWGQARAASVRVEVALAAMQKAMEDRIGKAPATIIAAMAGVIGYLAARAFPIH